MLEFACLKKPLNLCYNLGLRTVDSNHNFMLFALKIFIFSQEICKKKESILSYKLLKCFLKSFKFPYLKANLKCYMCFLVKILMSY